MMRTLVDSVVGELVVPKDELVLGRLLQEDGKLPNPKEEFRFLGEHVRPGDSVIDVGCNVGMFSVFLAVLVGGRGHVLSIDPNAEVLNCLGQTIRHHDLPQISLFYGAAGSREFPADFVPHPGGGSGGGMVVPRPTPGGTFIPITTLDSLGAAILPRPVSCIKIDAEGSDVEVLLGARNLLQQDRPHVSFEWNEEAMSRRGVSPRLTRSSLIALAEETGYGLRPLGGAILEETWPEQLVLTPDPDWRPGRRDERTAGSSSPTLTARS